MDYENDFDKATEISPSDYFNRIIGHIEDIVISNEFQVISSTCAFAIFVKIIDLFLWFFSVHFYFFFQILQRSFMNQFYREFTDSEENKMIYTDIFNNYTTTIETFIVENLQKRMSDIDMLRFTDELK